MTSSHDAILPIGPFADERAPIALDARCARVALEWPRARPLCCARGAKIDARAKIVLLKHEIFMGWAPESPALDDLAPSGVFERLADVPWNDVTAAAAPHGNDDDLACAALDGTIAGSSGGVFGVGCSLRAHALRLGLREDELLPDSCALFPLDLVDRTLVPSGRIPEQFLVDAPLGGRTLWDDARARVALRFGESVARVIDEAAHDLRDHQLKRALHLKVKR